MTLVEDIRCLMGHKKPDHKFGYNWFKRNPFNSMAFMFLVAMLIPVLNLYTGWFIVGAILIDGVVDQAKKLYNKAS